MANEYSYESFNESLKKEDIGEKSSVKQPVEARLIFFYEKNKTRILSLIRKIFFLTLIVRGFFGFWSDLKAKIIKDELGIDIIEIPIDPEVSKMDRVRKSIKEEKGIELTE